jgi:hypothetical protein
VGQAVVSEVVAVPAWVPQVVALVAVDVVKASVVELPMVAALCVPRLGQVAQRSGALPCGAWAVTLNSTGTG